MSYLEDKPCIGRRTNSKAQHRALLKKCHNQGTKNNVFCKTIVNPEVLTKKQRAKLINGSNDKSNFAFDVQYSLNRKYRWQQIKGADDLVAMDAHAIPQKIQVEGTTVAICLGTKRYVQTHFERAIDGSVVETTNHEPVLGTLDGVIAHKYKQKTVKSVALALRNFGVDDEAKNAIIPVVRYIATKPHPSVKMYVKGSPCSFYNKASDSGKRDNVYDDDGFDSDQHESDYDEEIEFFVNEETPDIYNAPKQRTFALSDFVVEKQKPTASPLLESSFELIDNVESCIDDFNSHKTSDKAIDCDEFRPPVDPFFTKVNLKWRRKTKDATFAEEFKVLGTIPNVIFRWLNAEKTSCIVDLSKQLSATTKFATLLIVFEQIVSHKNKLRIIVNGSFPCPEALGYRSLQCHQIQTPLKFVDYVVLQSQQTYINDETLKCTPDITDYQSVYYPEKFVHTSWDDRATVLKYPSTAEISTKLFENAAFNCLDNDSDFMPFYANCCMCGTEDVLTFCIFDGCDHTYCRICVESELKRAIGNKHSPLKCPKSECMAPVYPEMLYIVLPIAVVEFYHRIIFKAEAAACGQKTVCCPGCKSLLNIKVETKYGSIGCVNCNVCFCVNCLKRPHYPLICSQFELWNEKFSYQCKLSDTPPNRITKCQCGTVNFVPKKIRWQYACTGCDKVYYYYGKNEFQSYPDCVTLEIFEPPNVIAAPYSEMCVPLLKTRFHSRTALEFKKYCLRDVDPAQKSKIIAAHKLALHMLEFGCAWLYLNRGLNTTAWTDVKTKLNQLRNQLREIHTMIEQRVVHAYTVDKVVRLVDIVDGIMQMFEL